MQRCLQLAGLGLGDVAPNPMVGSVLVYGNRIIGEGYHMQYGQAHAEVNCLNSVDVSEKHLISSSTLYVSLEPCSHQGKTPPCTDLIINNNIPKVVIGCRDPFEKVNGLGVKRLLEAGIEVIENVLEDSCINLNKRFFTFHQFQRPYIILKWAQSIDHKIAGNNNEKIAISNDISNRLVHKWRSEEGSILIGTNTAQSDDPSLTTRLWRGQNPVRLIIDPNLRLPMSLRVFDHQVKTIVFNNSMEKEENNLVFIKLDTHSFITSLIMKLYTLNIQSVIVEGGAKTLQSFIDEGLWDEARVIINTQLIIHEGIRAPSIAQQMFVKQENYYNDIINYYENDRKRGRRLPVHVIPLLLFFLFIPFSFMKAQLAFKPFPQHVTYQAGTITPNHLSQHSLDQSVELFYKNWKDRYIRKMNEDEYYVWSEGVKGFECVSEGQGYGMVIIVYMAGFDSASQKTFDGLFKYFKAHPSRRSPGLMAWSQYKGGADAQISSATDGDMDIAYSLLLANSQWGSTGEINYLQQALSVIHEIMEYEINRKTWSVLLSNEVQYDSKDFFDMRTSDFMPASFKQFGHFSQDGDWQRVIDKNYKLFSLFQKKYSPDSGVLPDFILHLDSKPVPAKGRFLESKYDGCYNYNACRVPWRIGVDYLLNGDMRSKQIVAKINEWVRETSSNKPDNISAGYTLAGDDLPRRNYEALSFIVPFAVSAMVDSKNQEWLNKLWDYTTGFKLSEFDYYDNSIKMICMIIISRNYWQPESLNG